MKFQSKIRPIPILVLCVFIFYFNNIYSQEMLSAVQMRQSGKGTVFKQELKEGASKFKFFSTGQVSVQAFHDSDQFIGGAQGAVALFPAPQNIDDSGLDIHDKNQFSMFGISASIKTLFVGPDVWGGKLLGRLEAGFGGVNNNTVESMNISNAYISFIWKRTELRFGHYFHPLALSTTYATPVSGTEGAFYDPSRKVGLIRLLHVIDQFKFIVAAAKIFSSEESRRASIPDLFFQFEAEFRKRYKIGFGLNYHVEVPRLYSQMPIPESGGVVTDTYKTTESVNSIAAFVFGRFMPMPFLIKTRLSYIENGVPFGIMGSYSVQYRNTVTDERVYTPMRTLCYWADLVYLGSKRVEPGLFIGVSYGLGARRHIIKGIEYTDENNIQQDLFLIGIGDVARNAQYMFQIAPRLRLRAKNVILGFEVGYSRAAFGRLPESDGTKNNWQDDYNDRGRVITAKPVGNVRAIFSAIYAF